MSEAPYYFLIPKDVSRQSEFVSLVGVDKVMPINVTGMVTARDHLAIDFDPAPLLDRMRMMADPALTDDAAKSELALRENYAWRVSEARKQLRADGVHSDALKPILYRPFDTRQLYWHPAVVWRLRPDLMPHMLAGRNLGLILPKRVEIAGGWQHAMVTRDVIDHVAVSSKTIDSLFPLYLYSSASAKTGLFDGTRQRSNRPEAESCSRVHCRDGEAAGPGVHARRPR